MNYKKEEQIKAKDSNRKKTKIREQKNKAVNRKIITNKTKNYFFENINKIHKTLSQTK